MRKRRRRGVGGWGMGEVDKEGKSEKGRCRVKGENKEGDETVWP